MSTEHPIIVINADDFGLSEKTTSEIVKCMIAGRISSTTIMTNMPDFENACRLARAAGFENRIGIHLNLTHGPPLSRDSAPLLDGDGWLAAKERTLIASPRITEAVYRELRAQIARAVESGIKATHLDSHQHIINGLPYARIAVRLAKEFGIRRIRLTRNAFYVRRPHKVLFKLAYNRYLRSSGIRTTRWFTDVKPYFRHFRAGGAHLIGPVELMCHPGAKYDPALEGWAGETEMLLCDTFGHFLEGVRLVSYAEI